MSLDINDFVKQVKRAAVDAVNESDPMQVCFGYVSSESPLKITVDQKKILSSTQLILTSNVRDRAVTMQVNHRTEQESGETFDTHSHAYTGEKSFVIKQSLKNGEKVILLKCDGGQKYIVLDRWEA